ncbi:hypothetical protein A0J61_10027, partial [Choanephora cucurbitarum]
MLFSKITSTSTVVTRPITKRFYAATNE